MASRPQVRLLLMTYIVDLTTVLKLLFDITLIRVSQSGRTTWSELKGAFEEYESTGSRQRIHHRICAIFQQDQQILDPDSFHRVFKELVKDGHQDTGGPSSAPVPVSTSRPPPVKRKSTAVATSSPAPVATSNSAPVTTSSSTRAAAPEPPTGPSRRRRARLPCICQ